MERSSVLYKLRRRLQTTAYKFVGNEFLSKAYSRIVLKKSVNLKQPQTFNEKIQWLKIHEYPNNDLVIQCADKFRVRDYIEKKGLGDILVPLLGDWETVDEIAWDKLPEKFIIKCNHGCAYNLLCAEKSDFDTAAARKQLSVWMNEDFGAFNIEPHYSKIKPHIVCEEYLGECITDYKFFCFNGEPKYIYVSSDMIHDRKAKIGFFYLDGSKMPMTREDYTDIPSVELPPFYDEMKSAAEVLCKDFPFVRVDFFLANGRYYFAELTFTPCAGMMPFNPDRFDYEWGRKLNLSTCMTDLGSRQ